ncbi:helix-turn-helix domain-containing protein [Vagococcus luciliae]|uniref:HTH cro/C1-type domain-containing protein n=1 Tax=Vagococcus luciliae TaxID=2920380 RepID=A0ABY5NY28_9ENTE|nr:helix-turn-helix transcriptional regulator [Vagococcus luciliae]UUV98398.1 hypothetical protein G314FT_05140 [Vagococcus luciliae]
MKNNLDKKSIGQRIKAIRIQNSMTMKDFGKKFDPVASDSIVSRWERGISVPNTSRLKQIAEIGKVSMSYLLYGKELDVFSGLNDKLNDVVNNLNNEANKQYIDSVNYISNFDFSTLNTLDLYDIAIFLKSFDKSNNDYKYQFFKDVTNVLTDFIDSESDKDDLIQARDKIINELNKYIDSLD